MTHPSSEFLDLQAALAGEYSIQRERFLREARMAAGLSHPHIVPIHRVGEAGGFVFFVMSYVEGETLGERLRTRGPLPPSEATRVLREDLGRLAEAQREVEDAAGGRRGVRRRPTPV